MNMQNFSACVRAAFVGAAVVATCASTCADPVSRDTTGASPDSGSRKYFYTTYEATRSHVDWITCGANDQGDGCYGSGALGPFGRACAIAGSSALVVVADAQPPGGEAALYIYQQLESAHPSATLLKKLTLQIPSSATSQCSMAIGGNFVYFGTNESATFFKVDLTHYTTTGTNVCDENTSAITANNRTVVVSQTDCFLAFDKGGYPLGDGGQSSDSFVPGTNGFRP
jgi:hypothetical protein